MSLAVRPPRRSALGVTWCEDFRRGRLGVRKNQGTMTEVAGSPISLEGQWARFPGGGVVTRIEYPRIVTRAATGITVGCRWKNDLGAAVHVFLCRWGGGNNQFILWSNTNTFQLIVSVSGANRSAGVARTAITELPENSIVGTWASGDYVRLFINGSVVNLSAATYAGTVDDPGMSLMVGNGNWATYNWTMSGSMADPFVDMRQWSEAEIMEFHRKATFH